MKVHSVRCVVCGGGCAADRRESRRRRHFRQFPRAEPRLCVMQSVVVVFW